PNVGILLLDHPLLWGGVHAGVCALRREDYPAEFDGGLYREERSARGRGGLMASRRRAIRGPVGSVAGGFAAFGGFDGCGGIGGIGGCGGFGGIVRVAG